MNLSGKVYGKTGKGAQALSSKSRALSSDSKKILASIDGKTDAETLMEQFDKLPDEAFITMISQLEADGYIRFVKNKDWEFDDDDVGASSAMVVDELSHEDFFALTSQVTPEGKSPPTVEPESAAPESNEVKVSPSAATKSKADKKADGAKGEQTQHDAETRAKAEEKARQEAERKAHEETEQLAREEALTRKEAEAEVVAKANAAKLAAEHLLREEEEARQKAEAEARAKAETETSMEAERLAREEDARKQAEAEMRARAHEAKLEAERKARQEEDARQKAEARAKAEKDARLEAERIAKLEAKRKTDEEKALRQKAKEEERAIAAELAREQAEKKAREKAERKARQEEDARQKAEAEARAKAEKEARLEAERIAKLEAKRKANEEKALRQKAKDEAHAIAEEAARVKAEQKAIGKAERKAERGAERASRPPLDLSKWLKAAQVGLLYLPLVLAALVAIMHVVNLRILSSPMAKYVSEVVNEPVTIGQIRLSLLTSSLTLSEIKVESGADAGIGVIQLSPMVLLQSGKVRDLGVLEIEDIVVTRASIGRQLEWIKALAQNKDKLNIEEVALKNVSFSIPGLELEPFEGRITGLAGSAIGLIELESDDRRLNLKFVPINSQYKVTVNAAAWQPPFDTHLEFAELNAEGLVDAQQIRFDQIKAKLYSGTMTANVVIDWAGEPSITGGFELEGLSLPVALSSMKSAASVNGTLQAKGSFASTAGVVGQLADNLEINATFIASNGKINDVNLTSKVTSGGSRDSTTRFDKLTGNVRFKDGYYQYTQLALNSNQFKAKGNLNIQPDQEITGKVKGELATPSRLIRSNLNLSGSVGSVKLN